MKGNAMRTPVITEIYQQKVLYYTHIKKLERIRQERKHQLAYDSNRIAKFQEIRHNKSKSFAHRYNEEHHQITVHNKLLLDKLENVKPFNRYTSYSSYDRDDSRDNLTMTPFKKRRIAETEKQNSRIYMKVKSASSNLSKDKLLKDFAKSQQIKSRIARFATQDNKICLKSQKFLNLSRDRSNLTSHYNPQEIFKNKVVSSRQQFKSKVNKTKKETEPDQNLEKSQFFTTEPKNIRKNNTGKKRIYV